MVLALKDQQCPVFAFLLPIEDQLQGQDKRLIA